MPISAAAGRRVVLAEATRRTCAAAASRPSAIVTPATAPRTPACARSSRVRVMGHLPPHRRGPAAQPLLHAAGLPRRTTDEPAHLDEMTVQPHHACRPCRRWRGGTAQQPGRRRHRGGRLASRIAQDQAIIAARVLRVANSPFYGLQTQVGSIRDAIVVLGFRRCARWCSPRRWSAGCRRGAAGLQPSSSGATGSASRWPRGPRPPSGRRADELFIAGLLHDIGRLAMVVVAPEDYAEVIATANGERDRHRQEAEMSVFGYDHTRSGCRPRPALELPRDPRRPRLPPCPAGGAPDGPAALIHYADAIAKALDPTARTTPSALPATWRPSSPWTSTNPAWPRC